MDIYNQIMQLIEKELNTAAAGSHISEEKQGILKEAAALLEKIWEEWDFEGIELMAARGSKAIYIYLTSFDLIVENGRKNHFFQLVSLADAVRFSQKEADLLCIELQFRDIVSEV